MTPADLLADPWAFGPWCWVVDDVRLLPEPMPCRGMQGLWPLDWSSGEGESPGMKRVHDALNRLGVRPPERRWSALTVLQPFASAIGIGPKRVENRPWRLRVPPGGMWIGLHAGKALAGTDEEVEDALEEWRAPVPRGVVLYPTDRRDGMWLGAPDLTDMPRGAMLGAMHIATILLYPRDANG